MASFPFPTTQKQLSVLYELNRREALCQELIQLYIKIKQCIREKIAVGIQN